MPKIHEFYSVMSEYAAGRLIVLFPEWVRGLFCLAVHLRGFENLLLDIITEPEYVHKLLRFLADSNKKWNEDREKFIGYKPDNCKFFNDEVGAPTISPQMYKDFVFPHEKEIALRYGQVTYFHSCGNTTDFAPIICSLPNLKMFHIGPWADYRKVIDTVPDKSIAFEICLNPNDVMNGDERSVTAIFNDIKDAMGDRMFTIRLDGFMGDMDVGRVMKQVKMAIECHKRLFDKG